MSCKVRLTWTVSLHSREEHIDGSSRTCYGDNGREINLHVLLSSFIVEINFYKYSDHHNLCVIVRVVPR
jgi:hypothetical protein